MGFPCGSAGKKSACNMGDLGSVSRLGRSPGEGKGYPVQYSGLENSMDCIVHGVAKSRTQLSNSHFTSHIYFTDIYVHIYIYIMCGCMCVYIYVCVCMCAQSLSCVQLFVTPWTVASLLCPWDILGKNTEMGCHFLLQGIGRFTDQTHISCIPCISCTGRQILYH